MVVVWTSFWAIDRYHQPFGLQLHVSHNKYLSRDSNSCLILIVLTNKVIFSIFLSTYMKLFLCSISHITSHNPTQLIRLLGLLHLVWVPKPNQSKLDYWQKPNWVHVPLHTTSFSTILLFSSLLFIHPLFTLQRFLLQSTEVKFSVSQVNSHSHFSLNFNSFCHSANLFLSLSLLTGTPLMENTDFNCSFFALFSFLYFHLKSPYCSCWRILGCLQNVFFFLSVLFFY